MKLTRDVFLDTQVFETNNFDLDRTAFKEVISKVKADRIKVLTTSITVREVKKRIWKRVKEASNTIDKFRKDLRILANSGDPTISSHANRLNEKAAMQELTKQFEAFLKESRAEVLDCDDINPELVFEKYFKVELPFEHREEKQREFPDAFAIEVLKRHAKDEHSDVTCVSGDNGFRGAAKKAGMPVFQTVEQFLDAEIREWDAKITDHVLECYTRNMDSIIDQIKSDFQNSAFTLLDVDGEVTDVTVTDVSIDDEPLIVRIHNDSAVLETQVTMSFDAKLVYDDPDATVYDKEDGRTYVFNTVRETMEQTAEFPLEVTVEFDPSDDSFNDISIGRLNEGNDFEVRSSY
jgi:hypothetical protein